MEEDLFKLSDEQAAQHLCLNALVITLLDQGVLDGAKHYQRLCSGANFLEENGLPEAAALVDVQREWLCAALRDRGMPEASS